jgi:glucose uptake protein GlcU
VLFLILNLQDEKHPVENLLSGNIIGGKWLISASRSSASMAATFQLAECCVISSVHIGIYIFDFKWLCYLLMILVKVNH